MIRQSAVSLILMCCVWIQEAQAETVNRIVAIVNDEVITAEDVHSRVNALLESRQEPVMSTTDPGAMERAMLQRLIEQRLILQEAKRLNVAVSSADVLQQLEVIRRRFGSEDEFRASVRASGLSEEQVKEQVRDQLLVQRLIDSAIRATLVVSPQEVSQELAAHPQPDQGGDRVRMSHLLVRVTEQRSPEQARALVEQIHRQLSEGKRFSELVTRYAREIESQADGSMGWVAQGELMPALDAVVFSLQPGAHSQPIQSRLGFHLVQVEERRAGSSFSAAEAHAAVYNRIYQRKFQDAFSRWLGELKDRAYIEIPDA